MHTDLSLIDAAVVVLQNEKKAYDLYQLFDKVTTHLSEEEKAELVTKFYTDLTTSAKFVYVGENKWDLKANQKIELWEKDGSFYKEYTVIDLPEEFKEKPKAPKEAKPVVKKPVEEVIVVKEEPVVEEVKPEPIAEPVVEPVVEATPTEKPTKPDGVVENYEEEVFEEYEDFDEDKYNEYMDTYEDQYDD